MHHLCKFLYVYMHVCFVITEDAVRILTALFFYHEWLHFTASPDSVFAVSACAGTPFTCGV